MTFFATIHTQAGLIAQAAAEAAGTQIHLTTMAVGDGNGVPVAPLATQTNLVRERYRTNVNRVYQSPTDPTLYTAEMIVKATSGGYTMREVGIFDSSGVLFAVGNLPETYKPADGEGAFSDATIRMQFRVSNASLVQIIVDPNVAVASQQWVIDNVSALPPGGTTGQALVKNSNTDGDADWHNLDALNVVVTTIEEEQILHASQTQVDLTLTTTYGLALFVDGKRLRVDEWTADVVIPTRLVLHASYAEGAELTAVQNEPTGNAGTPLLQAQNLADLPNKTTARANLGVYSTAETDQKAPAGTVMHYGGTAAPAGWLKANGAGVSRTAYAALFAAIGTAHGAGDGFSTFNVPDMRGEFMRGLDDGRGVDSGRTIGSHQLDSNKSHSHGASTGGAGSHSHGGNTAAAGDHAHSGSTAGVADHLHNLSGSTNIVADHRHFTMTSVLPASKNYNGAGPGNSIPTSNHADSGNWQYATTNTSVAEPNAGFSSLAGSHSHSLTGNTTYGGAHSHTFNTGNAGNHAHTINTDGVGDHAHGVTVNADGAAEARPRNVALLACIKY